MANLTRAFTVRYGIFLSGTSDISTDQTTTNLLNTVTTTASVLGAATNITLGANTGTLLLRNATTTTNALFATSITAPSATLTNITSTGSVVANNFSATSFSATTVSGGTGNFTTLNGTNLTITGSASVGGSTVATATNALTLTNKTLTAPVINSGIFDGLVISNAPVVSTIVARNSVGDVYARYFNSTSINSENPTVSQVIVTNGVDGDLRKSSLASFSTYLDTITSSNRISTNATITSSSITTSNINTSAINSTTIGSTTPSTGSFTSLSANSATVGGSTVATGANTLTLTNKTLLNGTITNSSIVNGSANGIAINNATYNGLTLSITGGANKVVGSNSNGNIFVTRVGFQSAINESSGSSISQFITTNGADGLSRQASLPSVINAIAQSPFNTLLRSPSYIDSIIVFQSGDGPTTPSNSVLTVSASDGTIGVASFGNVLNGYYDDAGISTVGAYHPGNAIYPVYSGSNGENQTPELKWQTFRIDPNTIPSGYRNVILRFKCHTNQPVIAVRVRTGSGYQPQTGLLVGSLASSDDVLIQSTSMILPLNFADVQPSFQYAIWTSSHTDTRYWGVFVAGYC